MENECIYISTKGLMRINNNYNDNKLNINKVKHNDIISIHSNFLKLFLKKYLFKINKYFILITGNSDYSIPYDILTNAEFNKIINYKYLIKWYSHNLIIENNYNKIYPIPLGLDYHTI